MEPACRRGGRHRRHATVTVTGGANGFAISGRSWVTVSGFAVSNTSDYGIAVSNSSHITLSNNHVSYAGQPVDGLTKYGIRLNNVSDSLVSGNITDHNTNAGIGLVSGSTRNEVRGNESFANAQGWQRAAAGIYLFGAPDNTIAANKLHDNEDSGLNCSIGDRTGAARPSGRREVTERGVRNRRSRMV
jgi:Periplasmic copper-binding protein (NosD)